jgi:hypothetical protein
MCPLSDSTGSISNSQVSGEAGDIAEAFTGKDYYQDLIGQANKVPLIRIFKYYGIHADEHSRKITCPFKSHKGGRENSASFLYYPDTNSFCCFGCHVGGPFAHSCEFVAAMDGISRDKAAYKVLTLFGADIDEDLIYNKENLSERLEIMMDFSNTVREFHETFSNVEAQVYIEEACEKYDTLNIRKKPDNEALRRIVELIKEYIVLYKP